MRGLKAKRLRKAAKKYTPYSPWVQYEPQQFNTKVFSEWVTDPDTGAMTLEKKEVLITKTIRMSKFCGRSLYKELKTHSKRNQT